MLKILGRNKLPRANARGMLKCSLCERYKIILFSIILLALLLRLNGITHGYPYIFNVDEPALIRSARGLFFDKIIDHFDWPHFNIYFNFVLQWIYVKFRGLIQVLGLRGIIEKPFPILWNDPFVFYLISRIFNAILASLTIIPTYLLAKMAYGQNSKIPLVSAFILATFPFYVYVSHFAILDMALLFWIMCSIYFQFKFITQRKNKDAILAGIFLGLAVGTKYNAIMFLSFYVLMEFFRYLSTKQKESFSKMFLRGLKYSFLIFFISFFVFLVTTPSLIYKWNIFWSNTYGRGIFWQFKDNLDPLSFERYLLEFWPRIQKFISDIGILMFIFVLSIPVTLIINKKSKYFENLFTFGLYILTILIMLYTLRYGRASSHYYLPLYGFLSILASFSILQISTFFKKFWWVFVIAMLVPNLVSSVNISSKFKKGDSRTLALKYYENKRFSNKIYYKGEVFREAVPINNLEMLKYLDSEKMNAKDLLISIETVNDKRLNVVRFIDNKNLFGPNIYVYEKTN